MVEKKAKFSYNPLGSVYDRFGFNCVKTGIKQYRFQTLLTLQKGDIYYDNSVVYFLNWCKICRFGE